MSAYQVKLCLWTKTSSRGKSRERVRIIPPSPWDDEAFFFVFTFKIRLTQRSVTLFLSGDHLLRKIVDPRQSSWYRLKEPVYRSLQGNDFHYFWENSLRTLTTISYVRQFCPFCITLTGQPIVSCQNFFMLWNSSSLSFHVLYKWR